MPDLIEGEAGNGALAQRAREIEVTARVFGQAMNDEERGARVRREGRKSGQ